MCNGLRNCKFGWDEESCNIIGNTFMAELTSGHVILILVILFFILLGMCGGLMCNLHRKLSADKEELQASREKSLAASSRFSINRVEMAEAEPAPLPSVIPPVPAVSHLLHSKGSDSDGGCHVPDGGHPLHARRIF